MVRQRVRIRFCKRGALRLVGHRDLARAMERLFRRAGLTLVMSQGFHPKPRMSFPLALAVGIEGLDEVMELDVAQPCTAEQIERRLAEHALPGLEFRSVEVLPPSAPRSRVRSVDYRIPVPATHRRETVDRITRLMAASTRSIRRAKRNSLIDLRPFLQELALREGVLMMRLRVESDQASAGPRDVLAVLGLAELEQSGLYLTRTTVNVQ